ncbi:MAG: hypothetical protein HUU08_10015 [Candidatus Brocadia sp.]|nr:hypothetical protein [Candidatus Brocadia sp.]
MYRYTINIFQRGYFTTNGKGVPCRKIQQRSENKCGWRRGGQNVNYALSVKKIAGSLFDAICNVFFPMGFLRHYRVEHRENTASVQQGILFSIQIFLTRQTQRKDNPEEYCPVLRENTGKYV